MSTNDDMYEFWRRWFAQPEEVKRAALRQSGKGGWYPPFSETPGYTGQKDPKEYFHFRWPLHSAMDTATDAVFLECYEKARGWLDEKGLGQLAFDPRLCVLRVLRYLPTEDGCAGEAHRDFDLLTVSVPGTVPGLEVYGPCVSPDCLGGWGDDYGWHSQERGIQVGEMLQEYTRNDLPCDILHNSCGHAEGCRHHDQSACDCNRVYPLLATTHRVRTPPNTERYKAVFFYLPPNDFELRPGFTAGDYLKDALTRAGTINVGDRQ